MTTKISVIYDNPQDPAAFEAGFPDQLARAKQLPGLVRLESAHAWPKEDGSPTPAHRLLDLYFVDYHAASAAASTDEAEAFFPFARQQATGGVRFLFADVEET